MTNLEYVRQLPKRHLAELLVYSETGEEYDYDYDENPYLLGLCTLWFHPFCNYSFSTEEEAVKDCLKCLGKKREIRNEDNRRR